MILSEFKELSQKIDRDASQSYIDLDQSYMNSIELYAIAGTPFTQESVIIPRNGDTDLSSGTTDMTRSRFRTNFETQ